MLIAPFWGVALWFFSLGRIVKEVRDTRPFMRKAVGEPWSEGREERLFMWYWGLPRRAPAMAWGLFCRLLTAALGLVGLIPRAAVFMVSAVAGALFCPSYALVWAVLGALRIAV